MLTKVAGSRVVYVVSASSYFDPAHRAACAPQSCNLLRRTNNNGASFTIPELPPVRYVKNSPTAVIHRRSEDCVTRNTALVLKENDLAGLHTSREQRGPLVTNRRDAIKL